MCFLMIRQPPRTTRTDTLVPYTTLFRSELDYNGERRVVTGSGDGAISAFVAALGMPVRIMDYHEHAIGTGTDTRAASYVELRVRSEEHPSELQSLMRISSAGFCLQKQTR